MPTTEEWIRWSRDFAAPYHRRNHQLFLEMAMYPCRWYRDNAGMATVAELANADHYWLARYLTFLGTGWTSRIAATPVEVLSLSPALADVAGTVASWAGYAVSSTIVTLMTVGWDFVKQYCRTLNEAFDIPNPFADSSPPGREQIWWAVHGAAESLVLDVPYASDAIVSTEMAEVFTVPRIGLPIYFDVPRSAISALEVTMPPVPPLPAGAERHISCGA